MVNLHTLEVQEGRLGRKFRQSAIKKVNYNEWLYIFRYIDDGSFFGLQYINNKLTTKLTHNEVRDIMQKG